MKAQHMSCKMYVFWLIRGRDFYKFINFQEWTGVDIAIKKMSEIFDFKVLSKGNKQVGKTLMVITYIFIKYFYLNTFLTPTSYNIFNKRSKDGIYLIKPESTSLLKWIGISVHQCKYCICIYFPNASKYRLLNSSD